jgi:2-methylisocitrate lyase-like PEP mutase family enzyme
MSQVLTLDETVASSDNQNLQKDKARKLRKRLHSGDPLMLPEAWDVITARILADAGHEMIGISAIALAWSKGYQPEDRVSLEELIMLTERITHGLKVPVIACLEGVMGRSPDEIKAAVEKMIGFGCIGVTFSDGGRNGVHGIVAPEEMAACVKAAKAAAVETKVPVVIAASTEAFLLGPRGLSPFETSVERSEAYFAAGADVVMVPGLQHVQIIERLAGVVDGPIGISIGLTPAPDFKALGKAGVACVALGPTLMRSLLGLMRLKAEELLAFGHFNHLERAIPEDQIATLLR